MNKINKFLFFFIMILITSCASINKQEEVNYSNKSDIAMYNEAMADYKKGYFNIAGQKFEEIGSKMNFTQLVNKSIIMSIYSYFKAKKYDDSLRLIEYYKRMNFDSYYYDYISYMAIQNKYKKTMKSKRDLTLINELYKDIEYMLHNCEDLKYIDDLVQKRKIVVNTIVGNELSIYNFYISKNNLIGAINHLMIILNNFPDSDSTAEILYRLILLYQHIDYKEGVEYYKNILKINYNKTKWYRYVFNE